MSIEQMEEQEQREAFRYVFQGERSLPMVFKDKQVQVLDISAGGLAFKNRGFAQYEADRITLCLDIPHFTGKPSFSAQLRILTITKNGTCHCIFENCTIEEYEIIHKYVLEMQKTDIKKMR